MCGKRGVVLVDSGLCQSIVSRKMCWIWKKKDFEVMTLSGETCIGVDAIKTLGSFHFKDRGGALSPQAISACLIAIPSIEEADFHMEFNQ